MPLRKNVVVSVAVALGVSVLLQACDRKANEPNQPAKANQPAGTPDKDSVLLDDTTVVDLIDNPQNYKGKTITIDLNIPQLVHEIDGQRNGLDFGQSLQERLGTTVDFDRLGRGSNGLLSARLNIAIDLPRGLAVPKAKALNSVVVTFKCNKGDLRSGNVATAIKR